MSKTFIPIVENIKTKCLYRYEGENEYTNIITGVKGNVPQELANKAFVFCPEVSEMTNEYPIVLEMINRLNLKLK